MECKEKQGNRNVPLTLTEVALMICERNELQSVCDELERSCNEIEVTIDDSFDYAVHRNRINEINHILAVHHAQLFLKGCKR